MFYKPIAALAILCLLWAGLSCAQHSQPRKHVFYLHGMIVQVQGINAVSETFGPYRYTDIVDSLKAAGYEVHSEVRPPDTQFEAYARKISGQIDELIGKGVKAGDITVIGASAGAQMAMAVSDQNPNPVNYVLLAANSDRLESTYSWKLHGRILGIYERSDQIAGKNYDHWKDRSADALEFVQLEIHTGLDHGFLYQPLREWLEPARLWMDGKLPDP